MALEGQDEMAAIGGAGDGAEAVRPTRELRPGCGPEPSGSS